MTVLLAAGGVGIMRLVETPAGWAADRTLDRVDVRCLAAGPPRTVWAGTQGEGLRRSDDGGVTWRPAGLAGRVVKSVAASTARPGVVYAGLKPAAVAVSYDDGSSWAELEGFRRIPGRRLWFSPAEKPFVAYVQALALSPTDPDVVLAGIEFGAVVRSEDGGRTWTGHRRGALRDCHSLRFHALDGRRAYQGGNHGAALSLDAGSTWAHPTDGLSLTYGWAVAADPGDPDLVYLSAAPSPRSHGRTSQAAVFRRRGDEPWERLAGGLPPSFDSMPYAVLTDPAVPARVYVCLAAGEVWRSEDAGDSWTRLPVDAGRLTTAALVPG